MYDEIKRRVMKQRKPLTGMIWYHPDEEILFADTTQSKASVTSQAPSSIVHEI
jgi:hypothetical protein